MDVLLKMPTTSVQGSQYVHVEDDTVTMTRTDVVVQRAVKVEASQSTTVRSSQRRSNADSSQPPTKRGRPSVKDWEPGFRNQHEWFKSACEQRATEDNLEKVD